VSYYQQAGLRLAQPADRNSGRTSPAAIGKVIAVDHAQQTIDVVMASTGAIIRRIAMLSPDAGTRHGQRSLPKIALTAAAQQTANGPLDIASDTLQHDTWAMLMRVGNSTSAYVCSGFLYPESTELSINEPGLRIDRHESNVTTTVDAKGNYEQQFPDGSSILVKLGTTPTDRSATNFDAAATPWDVPDDGVARTITLAAPIDAAPILPAAKRKAILSIGPTGITLSVPGSGSVTFDTAGNISVSAPTTVTLHASGDVLVTSARQVLLGTPGGPYAGVARAGDTVQVSLPGSAGGGTANGTIQTGSATVQASG
jgi:hypothetical protein